MYRHGLLVLYVDGLARAAAFDVHIFAVVVVVHCSQILR